MKAALVVTGAIFAFAAAPALVQAAAAPPSGVAVSPARTPDGKPNLNGFWVTPGGMLEVDFGPSGITNRPPPANGGQQNVPQVPPSDPNLKSPYKEQHDKIRLAMSRNELPDYSALCIPNGMPRMMGMIYGMEILQTPKIIAITSEYQGTTRRIWMTVKEHPPADELEETFAGHSIGHWEGDTLVVDTVGIREDVPVDGTRLPHSPKLRIIERIKQSSPGVLVDEITLEDPDAYIKPIKQTRTYRHRPDLMLREYVCQDNNRNVDPTTGKSDFK